MRKMICLAAAAAAIAVTTATFWTASDASAGCTRVYTQMGWQTRCK